MKKWLIPIAILALVLAAVPVLALSGALSGPADQGVSDSSPIRSDEGIDPNECSWVHNITACEGDPSQPVSSTPVDRPSDQLVSPGPVEPGGQNVPVPPDRTKQPAPVHSVEIATLESFPPQYVAKVEYGLPNGCARPGGYDVDRQGTVIRISVWVTVPADPAVICTMQYGIAQHNVPLGSEFDSGQTYTVYANDQQTSFTAQ